MINKLSPLLMLAGLATSGAALAADAAAVVTPTGITYQPLGRPQGYGPQRGVSLPQLDPEVVYANHLGLTLYTSDADANGKSNCYDACAASWIPAVPLDKAKEVPNWKIIKRDDGRRQWAHFGAPVYTYKDDKEGGEVMGLGADPQADVSSGVGGHAGKALTAQVPQGWKIHKRTTGRKPTNVVPVPFGFEVKEIIDARGVVIVDNRDPVHQKALYLFNGDMAKDKRTCKANARLCPGFVPVLAPAVAVPPGLPDWGIVDRKQDGARQWAYKGQPIYTFEGDLITDDMHGEGIDKRWQVLMIERYFTPAGVSFRDDDRFGHIWTTPKGMALYRRDLNAFNPAAARFPHNKPYRPRVGRMIRDVPCDSCGTKYKPFLAPADAQPNGYWGIHITADGKKQWTYRDYMLWTHTGDKTPDDVTGDMVYEMIFSDDPNVDNDAGFPALYKPGFNWQVALF